MPRKPPGTSSPADTEPPEPEARPEQQAPPAEPTPSGFFDWIRSLDVRRQPGWIGGVCTGIALRLGIDPLIVRGIVVVVALLGGPALFFYAVAWMLLPDNRNSIHLENLVRGVFEWPQAAIGGLLLVSVLGGANAWFGWGWPQEPSGGIARGVWTVLVLGSIIAFFIWLSRRNPADPPPPEDASAAYTVPSTAVTDPHFATPPPTPPPAGAPTEQLAAWREQQASWRTQHDEFRREQATARAAATKVAQEQARAERARARRLQEEQYARTRSHPLYTLAVIGLALVAGGVVSLVEESAQATTEAITAGVATALGVLGLGIIINGIRGKRSGGSSAVAWICIVALAVLTIAPEPMDRTLTPTDDPDRDSQRYVATVGDVEFDLTQYWDGSPPEGDESVSLYVAAGDVTLLLPDDIDVEVTARVGSGSVAFGDGEAREVISFLGRVSHIYEASGGASANAEPLEVRLWVAAGDIRVERQQTSGGADE